MTDYKRREIAKVIIKVLKSKFDNFPDSESETRNAPFHKAFLQAFSDKFDEVGTSVDAMISMSSWIQGLNTSLGQTYFENVAHILSDGDKRTFQAGECDIYANQEIAITEIMTDLKNGARRPCKSEEDKLLRDNANGTTVTGSQFTVDCYFEDEKNIYAIEMKSVRPNAGETRGEKQKILKGKAILRRLYPNKNVHYYFGFPFDPTALSDTDFCKDRFMDNMIEFSKYCDKDEILLASEFWTFLSQEPDTMRELLEIIGNIATTDFMNNFYFLNNPKNMIEENSRYISIAEKWYLYDEIEFASNISALKSSTDKTVRKILNTTVFDNKGEYNERRARILRGAI